MSAVGPGANVCCLRRATSSQRLTPPARDGRKRNERFRRLTLGSRHSTRRVDAFFLWFEDSSVVEREARGARGARDRLSRHVAELTSPPRWTRPPTFIIQLPNSKGRGASLSPACVERPCLDSSAGGKCRSKPVHSAEAAAREPREGDRIARFLHRLLTDAGGVRLHRLQMT